MDEWKCEEANEWMDTPSKELIINKWYVYHVSGSGLICDCYWS